MNKGRLEAFTDGVIAIIITILVLEIKIPEGESFSDILPLYHVFISYILSFLYIGIYWSNHHNTLQAVKSTNGTVLWANLHLLFWLSLLPFTTGWMGENHFAKEPTLLYGFNLLMAAIAYNIFTQTLISHHGKESNLAQAFGSDLKGKISVALYVIGMIVTLFWPIGGLIFYYFVAALWIVPDKRMEKIVA